MKEILLCKYGEIVLKGANRKYFEDVLLKEFRTYLIEDPENTDLSAMTRLGLVEVTRKKIKKSLRDSLKMN